MCMVVELIKWVRVDQVAVEIRARDRAASKQLHLARRTIRSQCTWLEEPYDRSALG